MKYPQAESIVRRTLFESDEIQLGSFEANLGSNGCGDVWGQGFATEAACCVRDYARDVLRWPYAISAILP